MLLYPHKISLVRWCILLGLLLVWEGLYRLGMLNPIIFGSPSLIVLAVIKNGKSFAMAFWITSFEIVIASAFSWIFGVLFGLVCGTGPKTAKLMAPLLSAVLAIPLVVLYPVLIAWLGIGITSKIAFGAVFGFFPIALTTLQGVRSIDTSYIAMARANGARWYQILLRVIMPLALPAIVSGLRIGTALVVIGVLQGELMASYNGLGFLISYNRSIFNTGQVYLGIMLALVLALVANRFLTLIEARYSRWRL